MRLLFVGIEPGEKLEKLVGMAGLPYSGNNFATIEILKKAIEEKGLGDFNAAILVGRPTWKYMGDIKSIIPTVCIANPNGRAFKDPLVEIDAVIMLKRLKHFLQKKEST
jgi:hypothetical protein